MKLYTITLTPMVSIFVYAVKEVCTLHRRGPPRCRRILLSDHLPYCILVDGPHQRLDIAQEAQYSLCNPLP